MQKCIYTFKKKKKTLSMFINKYYAYLQKIRDLKEDE